MGIEAIDPQPRLSQTHPRQRVSPSCLRGVPILRGNQVWRTAITSMRLHGGCISRVAVMDGCSRYGLSWAISIPMAGGFGLEAFEQALEVARPAIFTRDPGAPCPSLDFPGRRASAGIQMSMAGRGRALDTVVVERRWRTVQ